MSLKRIAETSDAFLPVLFTLGTMAASMAAIKIVKRKVNLSRNRT